MKDITGVKELVRSKMQKRLTQKVGKEGLGVTMNRKRILEAPEASPGGRKDKIEMLKKAIAEGAYQVRAEDIAEKIFKGLFFELALILSCSEYKRCQAN